jgi:hypothetical protein
VVVATGTGAPCNHGSSALASHSGRLVGDAGTRRALEAIAHAVVGWSLCSRSQQRRPCCSALGPAPRRATGCGDSRSSFLSPTKLRSESDGFWLAPRRRMQVLVELWTPPAWHEAIMRWAQKCLLAKHRLPAAHFGRGYASRLTARSPQHLRLLSTVPSGVGSAWRPCWHVTQALASPRSAAA